MSNDVKPKVSKSIFKRWWFWLIVVIVGLAAAGKGRETPKVTLPMPSDERAFVDAAARAQSASKNAQNDMQRGTAISSRDAALCKALGAQTLTAKNWVGTVKKISSNSEGKGVLEIEVAPGVLIKTWNNSLSDVMSSTLIEPDSSVFRAASAMKPGLAVTFSGHFFFDITKQGCLSESSMTLRGKLEEPEFIFKFADISPHSESAAVAVPSATNAYVPPAPSPKSAAEQIAPAGSSPATAPPPPRAIAVSDASGELNEGSSLAIQTVAGPVGTQQAEGADRKLNLNGKPLFQGDDAKWQQPIAKFALSGGRDAVLMASSGGRGNSCEVLYYFLILNKTVQPKWTPEFGTCSPGGTYKQVGDNITLTMPTLGKMETSVFDGHQVTKNGKVVAMRDDVDPSK